MKSIAYSKQALKVLRRMQQNQAKALMSKVSAYAEGKNVDAKPLAGSEYIRIRIGSYRAILDDNGVVILVMKIGARGDVYK